MNAIDLVPASFMAETEMAIFQRSLAGFLDAHASPAAIDRWRANKQVEKHVWRAAGEAGLLGVSIPEEYGGGGGDLRHEVAIVQAIGHRGADALTICLHNAVILPYFASYGTPEQRAQWLPRFCSGEMVTAIAMTEPAAGSDLQGMRTRARRDGNGYRLTGQKTFISNGQIADVVLVAAKTDPDAGSKGISLFIVDVSQAPEGFARGRNLDKVGQEGQDTSELFFDDLFLPADALLGGVEGKGMAQLMAKLPQERLIIAWQAMAMIELALGETIAYVKQREMFGQSLAAFQNTQFKLAEYKTQATIAKVFLNHCTEKLVAGDLDTATASMAKYWISDQLSEIVDGCVQFFGGYGYMTEYPIGRLYRDSRIHRIYGGANEIMKLLIARTL
ncbi:acyl-CoA dehydrogenase family protein [Niveispirillum sp.]|uniref:acyl-CoA dehydrogenase family protein n=1 Tax=Niveispirillum sp. TaxID=1917217 RepID=UPI001B56BE4F|nr:acyl-CoA dehydrogenase family protein [Niveispirillum sp.]MBP7336868.1 acyl-CoA dehydrogenase family protein [Niveispirillum sp.]